MFLFIDECRFCLSGNDGSLLTWSENGERYSSEHVVEREKYGGGLR